MRTIFSARTALAALLAAVLSAVPALAQTPTPEGTVIHNVATVSWTDANGNTYSPDSASADVTVGFLAGIDITATGTLNPASPSTGNQLTYTITNIGNGPDSVTLSATLPTGVTITGYTYNSTSYATLADLNTALAGVTLTAGGSIQVVATYDVAAGHGGENLTVSVTATSRRDPTATAASDTTPSSVTPTVTTGVTVTVTPTTRNRVPTNGATTYSETFTVQNDGNASATFDLTASNPGATIGIVSVNGTSGSSGSVTVAYNSQASVVVVYTVAGTATGTVDSLRLTATHADSTSTTDFARVAVTVVRAAVTIAKAAYLDDQTTAITTQTPIPGDTIQYKITVTNNGGADASTVEVQDVLPAELAYVGNTSDAAGWTISESSGTVTAALSGALQPGGSNARYFWIRVRIK